jgi:hypothetical protein
MSIIGTVARAFSSGYAATARPEVATHAVTATMANTVQAGETVVAVNVSGAAKAVPETIKRVAPGVLRYAGTHLAFTAVGLEVIDLIENSVEKSVRRAEITRLVQKISRDGQSDALNEEIAVLTRADERRTFGQWVRDLPSRTFRRVTRLCLVEAGWWYMLLTLPISATAFALDFIYRAGLMPLYAEFAAAFGHTVDTKKDRLLSRFLQWLVDHTFKAGMHVFTAGAEMRLHNRSIVKGNTEAYPVLRAAGTKANEQIASIVDARTAFMWGEIFAQSIVDEDLSTEQIQKAYAQTPYWVEETFGIDYRDAILGGVRTGTPMMYRDLTTATA